MNKVYSFTFKDNEGDLYSSEGHTSLSDARAEVARLRKHYDGDMSVEETWIHDENGNFIARW